MSGNRWLGTMCVVASLGALDAEAADGGSPSCPTDAGTCVPISQPVDRAGGCSPERWIARVSGARGKGACPAIDRNGDGLWRVAKLFAQQGSPDPVPPALAPFCVYEWEPARPGAAPDVAALKKRLGARAPELAVDCLAAGGLGQSAAVNAGWSMLREEYHRATGWVSSLPVDPANPPAEVRVAVVDAAPDGYAGGMPAQDRSGHGHAIGWLVREHACPAGADPATGSACVAQVANHLALPHVRGRRDLEDGGYYGFQSEMARSIHAAVREWRTFNQDGGSQPRLVINLSIGWDPVHGGEYQSPDDLPAPVRAVHAAITHAACRGALVVAAAGNDPGGPRTARGAMYPAAWEAKPAPSPAGCRAAEGPGHRMERQPPALPASAGRPYRPLVYAVGAVHADDRFLESTRPGGRPRLAAPGGFAVAEAPAGPTLVLTGTSAAAAVTSAAAAAVWGYRPQLSAHEVMAVLRDSGIPLGQDADFCLGGRPCRLRRRADREIVRLQLCQAVQAACRSGKERCPAGAGQLACTPRPAHAGSRPRLSAGELAEIEAQVTRTVSAGPIIYPLGALKVCEHRGLLASAPAYPLVACPVRQFFGTSIRPWSGPQPSADPCPACSLNALEGSWTAYLSIDSAFKDIELREPVLRVNGAYDVKLPIEAPLTGGDVVRVTDLDLSQAGEVVSASISFTIEEGQVFSTSSEMLVSP